MIIYNIGKKLSTHTGDCGLANVSLSPLPFTLFFSFPIQNRGGSWKLRMVFIFNYSFIYCNILKQQLFKLATCNNSLVKCCRLLQQVKSMCTLYCWVSITTRQYELCLSSFIMTLFYSIQYVISNKTFYNHNKSQCQQHCILKTVMTCMNGKRIKKYTQTETNTHT